MTRCCEVGADPEMVGRGMMRYGVELPGCPQAELQKA